MLSGDGAAEESGRSNKGASDLFGLRGSIARDLTSR
jgi:hypothetical protein